VNREELLEDEFVRSKPEGIRLFSPGVMKLARKLMVRRVMRMEEAAAVVPDEIPDIVVLTYLMDERNSEQDIRVLADGGREKGLPALREYEMGISAVLSARCKMEVDRTETALALLDFDVERKPGQKAPPGPSGK
jgi:hypothetical protein